MAIQVTKFSMQGTLDVDIFNLETGAIEGHLDDCTTTGLEMTAEKVYVMGKGGVKLMGFSHSKDSTATIVHGYPTTEILALQSGQDVIVGTNTEVIKRDVLTVGTDAATTTFTALGTANEEIGVLWTLDANGQPDTKLEQAAIATTGTFAYTAGTKTIAFFASEIADGTQIAVYYNYTTDANAQTIKFDRDKFAGDKKVVFTGIAVRLCDNKPFKAQIIYHKGSLSDNASYSFEDTGDPIVQNLDITALGSCGNDTLVEWIIFDESAAS